MIRVLFLVGAVFSFNLAAEDYTELVASAKSHIVADFKDPYSAKFEGLFIGQANNGAPVVCGTVNGKNSYGAYVGRKRFYYMEGRSIHSGMEGDGGAFSMIYDAFCSPHMAQ